MMLKEGFPSNVLPWIRVSKEREAKLITVPVAVDGNWTNGAFIDLENSVRFSLYLHLSEQDIAHLPDTLDDLFI